MDIKPDSGANHRLGRLLSVSPSRAAGLLACPLSEAFRAGHAGPTLPTHPKAHFGIIVHNFLQRAARGDFGIMDNAGAAAKWRESAADYEEKMAKNPDESSVLPLASTCDDFEVNSLLAVKLGIKVSQKKKGEPRTNLPGGNEVDLPSSDGRIVGRADCVQWEGGSPSIIDLKTGRVTDQNGALRQELVIQIKLYAYLLHDGKGYWPESLKLQDLQGRFTQVNFSPSEVLALAEEVKEKLAQLNEQVVKVQKGEMDESLLASPSPRACRFCRYRISCEAYWQARKTSTQEAWAADTEGALTAIKPLGAEYVVVEIETLEGIAAVRGPRSKLTREGPELSRKTRICELKAERAPRTYSCKPITILVQR